jgi:hypothetical protein
VWSKSESGDAARALLRLWFHVSPFNDNRIFGAIFEHQKPALHAVILRSLVQGQLRDVLHLRGDHHAGKARSVITAFALCFGGIAAMRT